MLIAMPHYRQPESMFRYSLVSGNDCHMSGTMVRFMGPVHERVTCLTEDINEKHTTCRILRRTKMPVDSGA